MNEIEGKSVGSTFYLTAQTFILLIYLHIKSPFEDLKIIFLGFGLKLRKHLPPQTLAHSWKSVVLFLFGKFNKKRRLSRLGFPVLQEHFFP